jgi:hypothetical protein
MHCLFSASAKSYRHWIGSGQRPAHIPRIEFVQRRLAPTPNTPDPLAEAVYQGLREVGHMDANHIKSEHRYDEEVTIISNHYYDSRRGDRKLYETNREPHGRIRPPSMNQVVHTQKAGRSHVPRAKCADQFKRAAFYADRILNGANSAQLPV